MAHQFPVHVSAMAEMHIFHSRNSKPTENNSAPLQLTAELVWDGAASEFDSEDYTESEGDDESEFGGGFGTRDMWGENSHSSSV
jgi:hypothetical protein